jgi:hypothetical protein
VAVSATPFSIKRALQRCRREGRGSMASCKV